MGETRVRQIDTPRSWWTLTVTTFAFTVCIASWLMNGVLVTHLVDNGVFDWEPQQIGWLIGVPVLLGALLRLPLGMATDRWGGRPVLTALLLFASVPMYLVGSCDTYWQLFAASLGFGVTGAGFAVGIAFSSLWFSGRRQGLALGAFGAGNAGAALTTLIAPALLIWLTDSGRHPEGWRTLPRIYAALLVVTAILFFIGTENRVPEVGRDRPLRDRLRPLRATRVWRFGLYYFFVYGGFVALAQWLVPYYVNAYGVTVALAGALTAVYAFPSGIVRALGGWMSDRWGARRVMYWVFGLGIACCILLVVPQMDIWAPGSGVTAQAEGVVTEVTEHRVVVRSERTGREHVHELSPRGNPIVTAQERETGVLVWPRRGSWHEPVVEVDDRIRKKDLVARGVTHIFFQANIWIFTGLSFLLGAVMGLGGGAVYKHIPDYFPSDVGTVGGLVGVIGGLGGFVYPVAFGYLLDGTGLWTSCWMLLLSVALVCLVWMHTVIRRMTQREAPDIARAMDDRGPRQRVGVT